MKKSSFSYFSWFCHVNHHTMYYITIVYCVSCSICTSLMLRLVSRQESIIKTVLKYEFFFKCSNKIKLVFHRSKDCFSQSQCVLHVICFAENKRKQNRAKFQPSLSEFYHTLLNIVTTHVWKILYLIQGDMVETKRLLDNQCGQSDKCCEEVEGWNCFRCNCCWFVWDLNMPFGGTKFRVLRWRRGKQWVEFFTEGKTVCVYIKLAWEQ